MNAATTHLVLYPIQHGRQFEAYLDGAPICTSHQPLLDGARELLRRGFDPATLLTMRHAGKTYDSFIPKPIAELAKWTAVERGSGGPRLERYQAFRGLPQDARWLPEATPVGVDHNARAREGMPELAAAAE
jgi:hypothetical protein